MSQYPPNNGQPPNWQGQPWQGNQSQYPPQQPWGIPSEQPGQWGQQQPQPPSWQPAQYNQPTQAWQQPVPPPPLQHTGKPPKPPKKPLTKQNKIIGIGCLGVLLLLLCGTCAAINNANANHGTATTAPTTIVAIPSDTPTTDAQAVLPTDTPTVAPTAKPTVKPTPTPSPTQIVVQPTPTQGHTGVNGNPWGYDFNPGNYIDPPPTGFCNYFNCITTFYASDDPGEGWIVQCVDGTYSQSGGERGACSGHGGESRPLFSH